MTADPISFVIHGIPPLPNASRRMVWQRRAAQASPWRSMAEMLARAAVRDSGQGDDFPRADPVKIQLTFQLARLNRDLDNLIASCKPIIDGMAGVILADDGPKIVVALEGRIARSRTKEDFVIVEVIPWQG